MRTAIFYLLLLFALVGCSQEAPVAPPEKTSNAEAADNTVAAAPSTTTVDVPQAAVVDAPATVERIGDTVFSISPGTFAVCKAVDGAVVGTAKWDVTSQGVKEVAVYVESPDNPRKLWLNGGATGEEKTGNWVFDQTKFILKDRLSDREIAQLTIVATPCE